MDTQALDVATDDIGPVMARRDNDSQGDGVDTHETQGAVLMGDVGYFITLCFNKSQVGRILEVHAGDRRREFRFQVVQIDKAGFRAMGY